MFTAPPLLPLVLTLCSLGFVITLVSTDTRPSELRPTREHWRKVIETVAETYPSPSGAMDCGVLELGADAANAVRCIEEAQRKGSAFRVMSEAQGHDSQVWILLMGHKKNLSAVEFDSYGWESRGKPSFKGYAVRCKAYEVGRTHRREGYDFHEPAFSCVRE